jgi:hypothetical protein
MRISAPRVPLFGVASMFATIVACSGEIAPLGGQDGGASAAAQGSADSGASNDPSVDGSTTSFGDAGGTVTIPSTCASIPPLKTYLTPETLEPVLIGKWVRQCGAPEVAGEVDGVEFAADHTFYPLRRAANGSLDRVSVAGPEGGPPRIESWTIFVDGQGYLLIGDRWTGDPPGPPYPLTYSAPKFSPDGKQMLLTYAPWGDVYARAE